MTATMFALAGAGAVNSIMGGQAANKEAKYNASLLYEQAGMIENQKNLQTAQDERAIRFAMGRTVAATAKKGIEMSGSPMAIMIDTMTQMEMDKRITQYNYDMQKRGVIAQAEGVRRQGKQAQRAGVLGGLTSLFQSTMAIKSFKI